MHINPVLTKYREIHVSYFIKMMQKCPYMYFCLNIMTMDIYNAHNEVFGEDKEFLRFLGVLFIKQWSEVCTASLQASMNRRLYWCNEWPSHLHVFISCILGYSNNPQLFLFLFASFLLFLETRAQFEDTIKRILLYPTRDPHLTTSQLFSFFSMLQCI